MAYFRNLNPYDLHKKLINDYLLHHRADANKLFHRDTSRDQNDYDVLYKNHQFLWDDDEDTNDMWEKRFAKRYYDKLYREYCIADLSRYKENKVSTTVRLDKLRSQHYYDSYFWFQIALRWRIEKEVVSGKGQFICGHKICAAVNELRSWEVNFAYVENNEKKNALIKLSELVWLQMPFCCFL